VLGGLPIHDENDAVFVAASDGHALSVPASELALLSGAGKGTTLIKLAEGARVVGAVVAPEGEGRVDILSDKGKTVRVKAEDVTGSRASRGTQASRRDGFVCIVLPLPEVPSLTEQEER